MSHEPLADVAESWPVATSQDIWHGPAPFGVRRDEVSRPGSEETFGRLVVEHPGAVVVLAVDEDERALVLRQYRHPVGMRLVELPAGLLDQPGEDPEVAARRELLEEAALEAEHWEPLSTVTTSPGICAERIEVFLARGLTSAPDRGGFLLEHEEADMTAHWVPVDELVQGVLDRRVTDGPLAVAVLAYVLLRQRRA